MPYIAETRAGTYSVRISRRGYLRRRNFRHKGLAEAWYADQVESFRVTGAPMPAELEDRRYPREAAPRARREELDAPTLGEPSADARLTLQAYALGYLARRGDLEPATASWYRTQIGSFDLPPLSGVPIGELRLDHLQAWLTGQIQAQRMLGKPGLPTIRARRKALGVVFADARRRGVLTPGVPYPMDGLGDAPRETVRRARLEPAEVDALLDAAADPGERLRYLLMADAGLRPQEARGVTADSVVEIGGRMLLHISQVVTKDDDRVRRYTKGRTGNTRERDVPVATARLAEALREALPGAYAGTGETGGLLFHVKGVPAPGYRDFLDGFTAARTAAGLRACVPYDLRHHFGSMLGRASVPRSVIAELMGHADEATTAVYIHVAQQGALADLTSAALASVRAA